MRIVCLAWGSLIWKPGDLPLIGPWRPGGPRLPIEFARVGDKGELATALAPGSPLVPVRWAPLDLQDLPQARDSLRRREEIPVDRPEGIGSVVIGQPPDPRLLAAADIERWGAASGAIDAVVWTALPPRFNGVEGRAPAPDDAVRYLLGLSGAVRRHAEDYIRSVPAEIATVTRAALTRALAR